MAEARRTEASEQANESFTLVAPEPSPELQLHLEDHPNGGGGGGAGCNRKVMLTFSIHLKKYCLFVYTLCAGKYVLIVDMFILGGVKKKRTPASAKMNLAKLEFYQLIYHTSYLNNLIKVEQFSNGS